MTTAIVLIADGSEEIEFSTIYDVLVRAGVKVTSVGVGLSNEYATLSRGMKVIPDVRDLSDVAADASPTLVAVPGGAAGAGTLSRSEVVARVVCRCRDGGGWVVGICAGTMVIVAAGEMGGWKARVTGHPSVQGEVVARGWEYCEEGVVVDGRVVTSRGPGTSLLFALTVVEVVCGRGVREEVQGPMIVGAGVL